jgi:hypothetical protein
MENTDVFACENFQTNKAKNMAFGDFRKWLSGQLTKARQKETAWVDLASAIAESIEAHVESYIEKLKARSSLYEMDKESLLEGHVASK